MTLTTYGSGEGFLVTPSPPDQNHSALEAQLREVYGRIIYTHKTHEKMADLVSQKNNIFQWVQTGLAGLTTTSLLTTLFGDVQTKAVVGGVLSTALFILNLYMQKNDLGRRAERHTEIASLLWGIREAYLSLLTDLRSPHPDISYLRTERTRLKEESERVYQVAPRTSVKAYRLAKKAIKEDEEFTFVEAELDRLVPERLRLRPVKHEKQV